MLDSAAPMARPTLLRRACIPVLIGLLSIPATSARAQSEAGARSDTRPREPATENKIRAVARDNPMGEPFHEAANLWFGEFAAYTGARRF